MSYRMPFLYTNYLEDNMSFNHEIKNQLKNCQINGLYFSIFLIENILEVDYHSSSCITPTPKNISKAAFSACFQCGIPNQPGKSCSHSKFWATLSNNLIQVFSVTVSTMELCIDLWWGLTLSFYWQCLLMLNS